MATSTDGCKKAIRKLYGGQVHQWLLTMLIKGNLHIERQQTFNTRAMTSVPFVGALGQLFTQCLEDDARLDRQLA